MLTKHYKKLIVYFILFMWLLLSSAIIIFVQKIGFEAASILKYYSEKSLEGILKINLPHIFVFGVLAMIMLHFLVFSKSNSQLKILTPTLYIFAFLELFSPLAIFMGFEFFSTIKLFSFFIFIILLFYISLVLLYSIIFE
ncbi:hypothetical protein [Sulfurimonas sp.]|uniref:hypothetical protein n=1 Tax=Sulfurimonas sp. TaxID=2022749 RepID=UPI003D141CAF